MTFISKVLILTYTLLIFSFHSYGVVSQVVFSDEIVPNWNPVTNFTVTRDATIEETLHLISNYGFATAYPTIFGVAATPTQSNKSSLTKAMDIARGGSPFGNTDVLIRKADFDMASRFDALVSDGTLINSTGSTAEPTTNKQALEDELNNDDKFQQALSKALTRHYPASAWYYYNDPTCFYDCQQTEYFYWGLSSLLGHHTNMQFNALSEWELHTPQLVRAVDTQLYEIMTTPSPDITMPTRLPDKDYDPTQYVTTTHLSSGTNFVTPTINSNLIVVSPNATITNLVSAINPRSPSSYNRLLNVFGVNILGHEAVSTENFLHVAAVTAQWLDNNEDGIPDNLDVVYQLKIATATMGIGVEEAGNTYTSASDFGIKSPQIINGPNPFNPAIGQDTRFQYMLNENADVEMHIYSLSGTKVYETSIQRGNRGGNKGFNSAITWDGRNKHGNVVANGVYVAYVKFTSIRGTVFSKCKVVIYK